MMWSWKPSTMKQQISNLKLPNSCSLHSFLALVCSLYSLWEMPGWCWVEEVCYPAWCKLVANTTGFNSHLVQTVVFVDDLLGRNLLVVCRYWCEKNCTEQNIMAAIGILFTGLFCAWIPMDHVCHRIWLAARTLVLGLHQMIPKSMMKWLLCHNCSRLLNATMQRVTYTWAFHLTAFHGWNRMCLRQHSFDKHCVQQFVKVLQVPCHGTESTVRSDQPLLVQDFQTICYTIHNAMLLKRVLRLRMQELRLAMLERRISSACRRN